MNCALQSTIVGFANLTLGLCIGYYITKRHRKESSRDDKFSKLKDTLIADKIRLSNEVPNNQIMGNVSAVQGVVESLKLIIKDTHDIESINIIWNEYYKNEHRRKPFESDGPARKAAAIKSIDSFIDIIEKQIH